MSVEAHEVVPIPVPPKDQDPLPTAIKKNLSSPWATGLVIALMVLWTLPTVGLLITSLRTQQDVATSGWWTSIFSPNYTFDNYKEIFGGTGSTTYGLGPYFVNSFVISIPAALFPLTLACMAAYAIAWVPFRGATTLFFVIFALQVVPLQMALLPLLQMFASGWSIGDFTIIPEFGIAGTFFPVWIAHTMFALPLAIFLLHNFMQQLPRDLMEAAKVDGASHFLTFRKVVLPLTIPAIASFAIFQFLWVWNDLLVALTFAGGTEKVAPLTARLAQLSGSQGSKLNLLTAGAFIAIIVPLIVFFALQRFFVRGLLAGSVKG